MLKLAKTGTEELSKSYFIIFMLSAIFSRYSFDTAFYFSYIPLCPCSIPLSPMLSLLNLDKAELFQFMVLTLTMPIYLVALLYIVCKLFTWLYFVINMLSSTLFGCMYLYFLLLLKKPSVNLALVLNLEVTS